MIRTPGIDRLQTPHERAEDELDATLRPRRLDEFVGQEELKEQLGVSIAAAAARGDALDHVLLSGPPGPRQDEPGADRAEELGVPFISTAGPTLERKADIATYLNDLEDRAVFFVDEIHRLPRAVEETFYPGDGGPPAADHARRRPGREGGHARPAALHADRRDDPRRPADVAAARPLRHPAPARPLRAGRPRADRRAQRRRARRRDRRRGRARDRRPRARHAARGQPAAQARARLRRGALATARSTRRSPARRST